MDMILHSRYKVIYHKCELLFDWPTTFLHDDPAFFFAVALCWDDAAVAFRLRRGLRVFMLSRCLSECSLIQQITFQFLLISAVVAAVVSWGLADRLSPVV